LCKEWAPIYEEIAWEMKNNEDEITFTKVDSSENEVPLTVIQMPMLYIYRSNMKRIPVHFEGNITRASIIYFIRNYTTFYII
jgi:DNA modification methylase